MADPEFRIYISSTVDDLPAEREIARRVIGEYGVVKDSYRASDKATVETCTTDVKEAHLYVGILGHRYGWVPDGDANPTAKSITELEYDACMEAQPSPLKRLIFLRTRSDDRYRDSEVHVETSERIKAFRARAAKDQQPFTFIDLKELEIGLHKVLPRYREEFHRRQLVRTAAFDPASRWPTTLKPIVLFRVPGTDDAIVSRITSLGQERFVTVPVPPLSTDTAKIIEGALQQAQVGCLVVTPASLQRIADQKSEGVYEFLLNRLADRGRLNVILRIGVSPASLPPSWAAQPSIDLDPATLTGAPEATVAQLFTAFGAAMTSPPTTLPRVPLPLVIIAPTADEVDALMAPKGQSFKAFGDFAKPRGRQFGALNKAARSRHKPWPQGFYGSSRADWRCFGPDRRTVTELVETAVSAINDAPEGSRERSEMQLTEILLRRYSIDEYLVDVQKSRDALIATCRSALVCLDETALFDFNLGDAAVKLLEASRSAVVSISPCDPAHLATPDLLSNSSFLPGTLVARFRAEHDLQCELSLNSEERLLRWLRGAIPRLLHDLAGRTSVPTLVDKMDRLLATSGA